ncbi:MAG: hypothetical protein GY861_03345 [bacterium]|nr:hypothetical protein [bacterium]
MKTFKQIEDELNYRGSDFSKLEKAWENKPCDMQPNYLLDDADRNLAKAMERLLKPTK